MLPVIVGVFFNETILVLTPTLLPPPKIFPLFSSVPITPPNILSVEAVVVPSSPPP